MISFNSKHSGTVFIPREPIKNGFKIYVLADYRNVSNFGQQVISDRNLENLLNFGRKIGQIPCPKLVTRLVRNYFKKELREISLGESKQVRSK